MPTEDDPIRNALLESMVTHGRVLIFFFCHPKKFETDWNSEDVGLAKASEDVLLKEWREQANKRVAHLTTDRATALVSWSTYKVKQELEKLVKTLNGTPSDWRGNSNRLHVKAFDAGPHRFGRECGVPTGRARK